MLLGPLVQLARELEGEVPRLRTQRIAPMAGSERPATPRLELTSARRAAVPVDWQVRQAEGQVRPSLSIFSGTVEYSVKRFDRCR